MLIGDVLPRLIVTDLTVDGAGVARQQGRVVFIDGALPGSTVDAVVTGIRKGIVRAEPRRVLTPSPDAEEPWCPHFGVCGACTLQHLSREGELAWKRKHVRETLARLGKVSDIPVHPVVRSPRDRSCRNKMAFSFARADSGVEIGLRPRREHAVIPVTQCGMQAAVSMRILSRVRDQAKRLGLQAWRSGTGKPGPDGYLRFLVVHVPDHVPAGKQQILLECITGTAHKAGAGGSGLSNREAVRLLGKDLMERFDLVGFVHSERETASDVARGERMIAVQGKAFFDERFGPLTLSVPYNAFLQTNTALTTLLYERLKDEAALDGTQTVWDLYSGIGSIALYLAPFARAVHGFEAQTDAVEAARKNAAALAYEHCRFHAGALGAASFAHFPVPDLVVADPPRSGMDQTVLEALATIPARTLIYLSCDIATQARDISRLSKYFTPTLSAPFDMFPHTSHVENMVVLKRMSE